MCETVKNRPLGPLFTTILVWCKCNRQHRWLDTAITNMSAVTGPVQVYQTCKLVGASLTDMTAGLVQLLKTWQMV